MTKYAVWIQVDDSEGMYATMDNPFTYDIEPVIFLDKTQAELYAKAWKTGVVVEYKGK
jgi:hypothetical protein